MATFNELKAQLLETQLRLKEAADTLQDIAQENDQRNSLTAARIYLFLGLDFYKYYTDQEAREQLAAINDKLKQNEAPQQKSDPAENKGFYQLQKALSEAYYNRHAEYKQEVFKNMVEQMANDETFKLLHHIAKAYIKKLNEDL